MLRAISGWREGVTIDEVLDLLRIGFGSVALLKVIDLASRLPGTGMPLPAVTLAGWAIASLLVVLSNRTAVVAAPVLLVLTILIYTGSDLRNQHMYLLGWLSVVVFLAAARTTRLVDLPGSALVLATRIQLTIVYAFAFLAKITEDFLAGLVIAWFTRSRPVGKWLGLDQIDQAWPFILISLLAVGTEGALAIGLWSRRWWRHFVVLGILFHVILLVLMAEGWVSLLRLAVFGGLVVVMYVAFIPTTDEPAEGRVRHRRTGGCPSPDRGSSPRGVG